MKKLIKFQVVCLCYLFSLNVSAAAVELSTTAQTLTVDIELAAFDFRSDNPYLALWLSKDNSAPKALVVLKENVKWLRDLKKFWRKIAREHRRESDAVTGATTGNKNLHYQFDLDNTWQKLTLEVVRENGDRELLTLPVVFGQACVDGKLEIANFCVQLAKKD